MRSQPAEARIAAFLVETADDNTKRGYSPEEFDVGMTRAEIGNYLGTTLETVSRVISALSREKIIEARGKRVRVLDFHWLKARLALGPASPEQAEIDERQGMPDRR